MPRVSAGLLLFRRRAGAIEVFLAHPRGPFWTNKDRGAWSIPEGEAENGEDLLQAARRGLPSPRRGRGSSRLGGRWSKSCSPALEW